MKEEINRLPDHWKEKAQRFYHKYKEILTIREFKIFEGELEIYCHYYELDFRLCYSRSFSLKGVVAIEGTFKFGLIGEYSQVFFDDLLQKIIREQSKIHETVNHEHCVILTIMNNVDTIKSFIETKSKNKKEEKEKEQIMKDIYRLTNVVETESMMKLYLHIPSDRFSLEQLKEIEKIMLEQGDE